MPGATFIRADVTTLDLPPAGFDAVVALYSVIHVPLDRQPGLFRQFARWLRPGGLLLLTAGHTAWIGSEHGWLGGDAVMLWSHADAATYRGWLTDAGFDVEREEFVPEGDGGHAFFRATLRTGAC